ncbi:uncharacterized protein LOC112567624 [Pomacea canaliculata]|uniref:uncharacterized protein LOC112567624 n=1 Tax=Pomacea canaliculata TaxID=400727 RepID=UPI000D73D70B|nr:uncharacterized protein LOC112567624 [Pomacea canaliculata]
MSRTVNTSTITVNEMATPQKDVFKNGSLLCQTSTVGTKLEETRCQFDLIIPATGVVCSGEYNSSLWALTGQCDVARANSSRGRYYCLVYQINQKSPSVQSLVGNFTMSRPDTYVNGTCKINSPLPPEGNYSYNIIITPGQAQVLLSFTESSEIRPPSQPPSHNCPLYVEENDDVKCSCYTTDLGKPSGLVMWTETGSSVLRLEKVNRTQHENTYTCSLMWNNTDVLRVNYTLQVNYSSRVLTFKINNMDIDTVNVSENTDLTVVCKADGRPTPSLSLFKNIDNQKFKLAVVNDSDELTHTMTAVTCQDAGNYVCQSENIICVDAKSIQVFVFCEYFDLGVMIKI